MRWRMGNISPRDSAVPRGRVFSTPAQGDVVLSLFSGTVGGERPSRFGSAGGEATFFMYDDTPVQVFDFHDSMLLDDLRTRSFLDAIVKTRQSSAQLHLPDSALGRRPEQPSG